MAFKRSGVQFPLAPRQIKAPERAFFLIMLHVVSLKNPNIFRDNHLIDGDNQMVDSDNHLD